MHVEADPLPELSATSGPREESGRLICPDCSATLPSGHMGAGPSAESGDPRSSTSALDFPLTGPPRPSGSITLLRSGLRSEEKTSQGGWMEGLFARRGKAPADQVPPSESPVDRAPIEEPVGPRPSTRSTRLDLPGSGVVPSGSRPADRTEPLVDPGRGPRLTTSPARRPGPGRRNPRGPGRPGDLRGRPAPGLRGRGRTSSILVTVACSGSRSWGSSTVEGIGGPSGRGSPCSAGATWRWPSPPGPPIPGGWNCRPPRCSSRSTRGLSRGPPIDPRCRGPRRRSR